MSAAIKAKLRSGRPTIGSWMQLPDTSVAEIMGRAGYDWVALDLEHGLFGVGILADMIRAIELGGTLAMARVAANNPVEIKRALEAGVSGIIVPMIETREQVEAAASWAKYPPVGQRGVGFSRANLFGKLFDERVAAHNDQLVLVAQIESISAIRSLGEILAAGKLDAVMIGPYDLSASMGLTGQFDHRDFRTAISEFCRVARQHGVPFGAHVVQPNPALLQQKIDEGYQWLAYGVDALFLQSVCERPPLKEPTS